MLHMNAWQGLLSYATCWSNGDEASRALAESMNRNLSLEQLAEAIEAAHEGGLPAQDPQLAAAIQRLAVEQQRQEQAAARLTEAMARSARLK